MDDVICRVIHLILFPLRNRTRNILMSEMPMSLFPQTACDVRDAHVFVLLMTSSFDETPPEVRDALFFFLQGLDKINPGWQRYRFEEIRQDYGNISPRQRRALPSVALIKVSGIYTYIHTCTHKQIHIHTHTHFTYTQACMHSCFTCIDMMHGY